MRSLRHGVWIEFQFHTEIRVLPGLPANPCGDRSAVVLGAGSSDLHRMRMHLR